MALTFDLTVAGISRIANVKQGTVRIQRVYGKRHVFGVTLQSLNGVWYPAMNDEVIWSTDAGPQYGGFIREIQVFGQQTRNIDTAFIRIVCGDYHSLLEERKVTDTFAAGQTLKQWLQQLQANWLAPKGITIHASQADGPTMTNALTVDVLGADKVLEQFMLLSQWTSKGVDAAKVLRLVAPGTVHAPFDMVQGDRKAVGDIQVFPLWNGQKYNVVIIKGGPPGVPDTLTEQFTGDGVKTFFTLTEKLTGWIGATVTPGTAVGYGYIDSSVNGRGAWGTTGTANMDYYYDVTTNRFQKASGAAFANGEVLTVKYDYRYPFELREPSTPPSNPIEFLLVDTNIRTRAVALQKAQNILAITLLDTERIRFDTFEDGIEVGQTMHLDIPARHFDADCIITDITTFETVVNPQTSPQYKLRHTVTAVRGDQPRRGELDIVQQWSLMGGGGGGTAGTAPQSGGMAVPCQDTRVIFSDNFGIGCADSLRYMKTLQETRFSHSSDHTKYTRIRVVNATGDGEMESKGSLSFIAALSMFLTSGGFTGIDAVAGIQLDPGAVGATDAYTDLNKLTLLRSACQMFIDISTSPFTVHTTSPSNTNEVLTYFGVSGSSAITLPPLANLRIFPITSVRRLFFFVNTKTSGDLTISGNSGSELINGNTSITVGPGGAVLLGGHSSTNWRVMGGFGSVSVGGSLISPPFATLTADPGSPADDTWWIARSGTTPNRTFALKLRDGGTTHTMLTFGPV